MEKLTNALMISAAMLGLVSANALAVESETRCEAPAANLVTESAATARTNQDGQGSAQISEQRREPQSEPHTD